ncbi:MAG TPA: alkaline phosphatase family protein [Stellaceae bacterium]|nr:alkaline phosphatase family protein [Stellaceae bacterium]
MSKVLIVVFDGLRPDMVRPALTPNLCRFRAAAAQFPESRAVFPTETRVNGTSLVTGVLPGRHGIVANRFYDPAANLVCVSGKWQDLEALERALDRPLLEVPCLGEILAGAGASLAVIGTGTPGVTRLLHSTAERHGQLCLSLHGLEASRPRAAAEALVERVGPLPAAAVPNLGFLRYATTAYLDYVLPEFDPDAAIIWYCEPDTSFHHRGIGSPASIEALREVDAQFGRLLDYRDHAAPELTIVTLSDHGQISTYGERLGIGAQMAAAGFSVGEMPGPEAELSVVGDSGGGIYVRNRDAETVARAARWLQAQPWCGLLFVRGEGLPGVLSQDVLGIAHARAADIVFTLASDSGANAHGLLGRGRHDSAMPEGGGVHGGLHRLELTSLLAISGRAFRRGYRSPLPAGILDVLPTVLSVLGIEAPAGLDGRVLSEAMLDAHPPEGMPTAERFSASIPGYRQHLLARRLGPHRYLDHGGRS